VPELIPGNPLEQGLASVRSGLIELTEFLHTFVFAEIVVPSGTEPQADGSGFTPLLFEKNGFELVAAYTSGERVPTVDGAYPYCLLIRGGEFLRRMSANYGLVINPGWSLGMEISPDGVRRMVDNMAEPIFDS
jgi:hypothetical protein